MQVMHKFVLVCSIHDYGTLFRSIGLNKSANNNNNNNRVMLRSCVHSVLVDKKRLLTGMLAAMPHTARQSQCLGGTTMPQRSRGLKSTHKTQQVKLVKYYSNLLSSIKWTNCDRRKMHSFNWNLFNSGQNRMISPKYIGIINDECSSKNPCEYNERP
jgi:hypothetical protein